eukprot:403355018
MRLKNANNISYTISEMPPQSDVNQTQEADFHNQFKEDTLERDQDDIYQQNDLSNIVDNQYDEHKQTNDPRKTGQKQHYKMTAITRPKSSLQYGRIPFKGTLHHLQELDREKSLKKGQKMQKITQQIRESQEKILLLQSRINTLKRQDEKSGKRVEQMHKTKSVIITNRKQFETIKDHRYDIQLKRQQELEDMKVKIAQMKKQNDEIRGKIKQDQMKKQKSQRDLNQQHTHALKIQLAITTHEQLESAKCITSRVRDQRLKALERRRSQEKEFIDHIQYQYHKDRKKKMHQVMTYEEQIKQLELQEQMLVDQLSKTFVREQKEAIDFKESLIKNANSNDLMRQSIGPNKNSKSQVDILDLYQTPRTTKRMLDQQQHISQGIIFDPNNQPKITINQTSKSANLKSSFKTPQNANIRDYRSGSQKGALQNDFSVTPDNKSINFESGLRKQSNKARAQQNLSSRLGNSMSSKINKSTANIERDYSQEKHSIPVYQNESTKKPKLNYSNLKPVMQKQQVMNQISMLQKANQDKKRNSLKQDQSIRSNNVSQQNISQDLGTLNQNPLGKMANNQQTVITSALITKSDQQVKIEAGIQKKVQTQRQNLHTQVKESSNEQSKMLIN